MEKDKESDKPNAWPVANICFGHGLYLASCGYYGAAVIGKWEPSAMHSLYAGAGAGVILGLCGSLSVSSSHRLYMIGVHVALLLDVILFGVFTFQAYKSYTNIAKIERFPLFVAMSIGTLLSLVAMIAFKPPSKKKDKKAN